MKNVLWLRANGTKARLEAEKEISLEDMQALVGGYITIWPQRVDYHGASLQLVVNEEGSMKCLPVNEAASRLVKGLPDTSGAQGNRAVKRIRLGYDADTTVLGDAIVCLDGDVP